MKKSIAILMVVTLFAGCNGTLRHSIPVVDSGTQASPGAIRDSRARPSGAEIVTRENAPVVAYRQDEKPYSSTYGSELAPSSPIQEEVISDSQIAYAPPAPSHAPTAVTPNTTAAQIDAPVLALLTTAQQQQNQGDLNGAAASLERAQRIAPQEPQILYRMAEVRLAQGDAQQAEQLAQRGLTLSAGRPALQAGLWDLIADAREKRGDTAGADEARKKARVSL